ncbi:MAG: GNAT family N-acetyltransferase [Desulfovibrio sp.]|jgi:GNAT superfamily N-acetyltransferase|nr:GNAT family N-acetyltransferase [Desulfovibrio sp.]
MESTSPARFTHRPVEDADLSDICAFPRDADELFFCFPTATFPLTSRQLREAVARRADATVALLDGRVAAFANFHHWKTGGRCAIGNVMVDPLARGRGAARYLVSWMVDLAFTKHRAVEVGVSCFNRNTAGLLLYAGLGFGPHAVEERRDTRGNHVALIHLRLPRPTDLPG